MDSPGETKPCRHCAETIKVHAIICPHCRFWQKFWTLRNPVFVIVLWPVLALAALGVVMVWIESRQSTFETYRDQILVVNSSFTHRTSGSNLLVTVVGTVTNRTHISWKNVAVEARFFDQSGKLIDAITANAQDYEGVVLLAHGEAAFKLEGRAARPASDYETCKVAVHWAKDAHTWP